MVRRTLEHALSPQWIDDVFEANREQQYTRELLFSTVVDLMRLVALGLSPSPHEAAQSMPELAVSLAALYDKVNRPEPQESTGARGRGEMAARGDANDIYCVVQGDNPNSMPGPLGGGANIELGVLVARRALEWARALLASEVVTPKSPAAGPATPGGRGPRGRLPRAWRAIHGPLQPLWDLPVRALWAPCLRPSLQHIMFPSEHDVCIFDALVCWDGFEDSSVYDEELAVLFLR